MIRVLDLVLALFGLVAGLPVFLALLIAGYVDTGKPVFRQTRVGRHGEPFVLLKFRTMRSDTPSMATHLTNASAITPLGRFLRKSKLDELPQLWNVVRGEMSLVGPRPCLFSQEELIAERQKRGVLEARPGITGLAQIRGIDMSTPTLLAETDARMLENLTIASYLGYISRTVTGSGRGDRVRGE